MDTKKTNQKYSLGSLCYYWRTKKTTPRENLKEEGKKRGQLVYLSKTIMRKHLSSTCPRRNGNGPRRESSAEGSWSRTRLPAQDTGQIHKLIVENRDKMAFKKSGRLAYSRSQFLTGTCKCRWMRHHLPRGTLASDEVTAVGHAFACTILMHIIESYAST